MQDQNVIRTQDIWAFASHEQVEVVADPFGKGFEPGPGEVAGRRSRWIHSEYSYDATRKSLPNPKGKRVDVDVSNWTVRYELHWTYFIGWVVTSGVQAAATSLFPNSFEVQLLEDSPLRLLEQNTRMVWRFVIVVQTATIFRFLFLPFFGAA